VLTANIEAPDGGQDQSSAGNDTRDPPAAERRESSSTRTDLKTKLESPGSRKFEKRRISTRNSKERFIKSAYEYPGGA